MSQVAILPTRSRRLTPRNEELSELVPLEEIDFFQDQCSEIRPRHRPLRSGQTEPTVATSTPSPAGSAVRRLNPTSIHAWTKRWTCPVLFLSIPASYPRYQPRYARSASNPALLRRRRPRPPPDPPARPSLTPRRLCSSSGGPCSRWPPGRPNCCLQAQLGLGSDPTARARARHFDQHTSTWRPLQPSMSSPSLQPPSASLRPPWLRPSPPFRLSPTPPVSASWVPSQPLAPPQAPLRVPLPLHAPTHRLALPSSQPTQAPPLAPPRATPAPWPLPPPLASPQALPRRR
jgi:hypothetical protein